MSNNDILAHVVMSLLIFSVGFMAAIVLIAYLDYKQDMKRLERENK